MLLKSTKNQYNFFNMLASNSVILASNSVYCTYYNNDGTVRDVITKCFGL